MGAAKRHHRAETKGRKSRDDAGDRRDRAWSRGGLAAPASTSTPTAIRNCRIRCGICPDAALSINVAVK